MRALSIAIHSLRDLAVVILTPAYCKVLGHHDYPAAGPEFQPGQVCVPCGRWKSLNPTTR